MGGLKATISFLHCDKKMGTRTPHLQDMVWLLLCLALSQTGLGVSH